MSGDASTIHLRYLALLASAAALGGLLFGFDIAIITGAGPFLAEQFHLGDLGLGWAFSALLFGCVVGSGIAGRLTDSYGRRKILLWVAVLFVATSVAAGIAPSFSVFISARFMGGLAVGGASILSPMYVAEISPPSLRGRLGTLYQMSIVTGILVSYAINYLLRGIGPDNWRWMFITGVIPSIIFFFMLLAAPETPRWLFLAGRESEARRVLERIVGEAEAEKEVSDMRASVRSQNSAGLLRSTMRKPIIVSFWLAILIHVSGINTIIDYAPGILRSAGWNIDAALFSTIIIGLTNFVFTFVSFWAIDRYGRKPLYIIGSVGMCFALVLLMSAVLAGHFERITVLVCILGYLALFSACVGPVFWTLVPEMFPNSIRGVGMSVPVLTQWIANAAVVLLFPIAFHQIGKAITFGFLAVMALTQAVFTYFFVPETKNKSLEEMERLWERPTPKRVLL